MPAFVARLMLYLMKRLNRRSGSRSRASTQRSSRSRRVKRALGYWQKMGNMTEVT